MTIQSRVTPGQSHGVYLISNHYGNNPPGCICMGHQWSYLYLPNHPQISPIDGTLFNLGPKKEIPKQTEPSTGAIRPSNHSGTHLPWSPPVSSTKWIIFLRRFGNRVIWRGSGSPPGFCIYCKEPIRIWLEIGGKDPLANQIVPRHGRPLPCGGAISERRPMCISIPEWLTYLSTITISFLSLISNA